MRETTLLDGALEKVSEEYAQRLVACFVSCPEGSGSKDFCLFRRFSSSSSIITFYCWMETQGIYCGHATGGISNSDIEIRNCHSRVRESYNGIINCTVARKELGAFNFLPHKVVRSDARISLESFFV